MSDSENEFNTSEALRKAERNHRIVSLFFPSLARFLLNRKKRKINVIAVDQGEMQASAMEYEDDYLRIGTRYGILLRIRFFSTWGCYVGIILFFAVSFLTGLIVLGSFVLATYASSQSIKNFLKKHGFFEIPIHPLNLYKKSTRFMIFRREPNFLLTAIERLPNKSQSG